MTDFTYRYRASGLSWGMYIRIECVAYLLSEYQGEYVPVTDTLYFAHKIFPQADVRRVEMKEMSFKQGLLLIADIFSEVVGSPTVIEVIETYWTPTDFHVEAYGYAIAGWVIQEYDLGFELPHPVYDKDAGRYMFPYRIE